MRYNYVEIDEKGTLLSFSDKAIDERGILRLPEGVRKIDRPWRELVFTDKKIRGVDFPASLESLSGFMAANEDLRFLVFRGESVTLDLCDNMGAFENCFDLRTIITKGEIQVEPLSIDPIEGYTMPSSFGKGDPAKFRSNKAEVIDRIPSAFIGCFKLNQIIRIGEQEYGSDSSGVYTANFYDGVLKRWIMQEVPAVNVSADNFHKAIKGQKRKALDLTKRKA